MTRALRWSGYAMFGASCVVAGLGLWMASLVLRQVFR